MNDAIITWHLVELIASASRMRNQKLTENKLAPGKRKVWLP